MQCGMRLNEMHLLMCAYAQSPSRRMFYNMFLLRSMERRRKKKQQQKSHFVIYFHSNRRSISPSIRLPSLRFGLGPIDSDLFEYVCRSPSELCRPAVSPSPSLSHCVHSVPVVHERIENNSIFRFVHLLQLTYGEIVSSPVCNL